MSTDRVSTITAYSLTEAAKRLGLSRWTLQRAIKDGKLAAHRSGGAVIIFAPDLLDYVLSHRQGRGIPGA
jgi:excisionase family DNA binding protein